MADITLFITHLPSSEHGEVETEVDVKNYPIRRLVPWLGNRNFDLDEIRDAGGGRDQCICAYEDLLRPIPASLYVDALMAEFRLQLNIHLHSRR